MYIENIEDVLRKFNIQGSLLKLTPLGNGNINDTYLGAYRAENGYEKYYVHQRVNSFVFKNPILVVNNMRYVTEHILKKLVSKNFSNIENDVVSLKMIAAYDGSFFVKTDYGDIWRTTEHLSSLVNFDILRDNQQAYEIGKCLGEFHEICRDLDVNLLGDTLPDFHHTEKYFSRFVSSLNDNVAIDKIKASSELREMLDYLLSREYLAFLFSNSIKSGVSKIRTVHNDPKVNNFMFCPLTGQAKCMIDLDTVKPGIISYDFGDCIRSAANVLGEETTEFDKVAVNLEYLKAITAGYRNGFVSKIDKSELELLVVSSKILAFELCIRFLTSYLLDDGYFKENYKGNNYSRAIVQYRLMRDLELKENEIKSIFYNIFKY